MIRTLFSRLAFLPQVPASFISKDALADALIVDDTPAGQTVLRTFDDGQQQASIATSRSFDGAKTEFEMDIKKDGRKFVTKIAVTHVTDNVCHIDSFVFDNRREEMRTSGEVMNALSYIGQQIRALGAGSMAQPHNENEKPFSRAARARIRFWS